MTGLKSDSITLRNYSNKLVGAEKDGRTLDESMAYAFDMAWLMGFQPKFEYENQVWEENFSLEEAVGQYTLRIASAHNLSEEHKQAIRSFLENIAADSHVHETSHTLIVAMYWQVNPAVNNGGKIA